MTTRPPLFRDLTFDAAAAAATAEGKVLLVDFTAEWCPPCRNMDKTTWVDERVVRWVEQHAVAVQLDTDRDKTGEKLEVRALPTLMLFKDDRLLDRVSGARSPEAFLAWVQSVEGGRTELDLLREAPSTDLHRRFALAQALVERGIDAEATEELAWLWEHALEVDEAWYGVKHSYLIEAARPLVKRSAKARGRFERLRELARGECSNRSGFHDWLTLSSLLGDDEGILAFVAGLDPDTARTLRVDRQRRVVELLEERGRWDLLGSLIDDPLMLLREQHQLAAKVMTKRPDFVSEEDFEQTRVFFQEQLREKVVALIRAMTAVGREPDVARLREEALTLDPSGAMRQALDAMS